MSGFRPEVLLDITEVWETKRNPLTRLVLAPDWPLITWTEEERKKGQAWGLKTIESFHTHGTPPVAQAARRTEGLGGRRPAAT
ncbi:hypothetical protein BN159_1525 [Streptomyces davaonensis JCM 4913]|uniref:Uncharacterized protein n=1 Tax=Streptomyces davaonensis (strain DSM 101723 / JCM 4913 / KCC S-0913 / 768) TaxID=1214101 RepID=K4QZV0_STRDJ|nr:hypothetical protein BN159_1525 [Streptomyces davaonensis JCM 4913]